MQSPSICRLKGFVFFFSLNRAYQTAMDVHEARISTVIELVERICTISAPVPNYPQYLVPD
jgi:hypothetical protein